MDDVANAAGQVHSPQIFSVWRKNMRMIRVQKYLRKNRLYPKSKSFRMPEDILEEYTVQHIEAFPGPVINLINLRPSLGSSGVPPNGKKTSGAIAKNPSKAISRLTSQDRLVYS